MEPNGKTFVLGGLGCLGSFLVFGLIMVLIGGYMHIDLCGAIALFLIGGFLALLVAWIYNKGKQDGMQ
ncbi:MAG TPA: hypothetical protein DCM28_18575 [Phycisphaerales bacterium]|nr:hypothetical protein [Phycisphaerales bacterium]|tara:strand:+ start:71 stop:274 length:204 start_codon:yes stop_codon:yes gene_type:complete